MANTQNGYLLIADITGYTQYLSESELEHAQATLAALLELLIAHTRPPLIISRLAGDAVISYGLRDGFYQGQTFVEMIEVSYVDFRKAIERMVLNTTCGCQACANIKSLDLKFFVHYGRFAIQRLNRQDELVGSDVNVIHRLLKNHVTAETGARAYTLYTDAALRQLGLEGAEANLRPHTESYEHLGEVRLWVQDMHPVWEQKRKGARLSFAPETVLLQVSAEIALAPERVWDYLSQPEFRKTLIGTPRSEVIQRVNGRVGPGSVYQCYHGKHLIPQTVLEWEPFEQVVTQDLIPVPVPNTYGLVQYRLEATGAGTRLTQAFGALTGPRLGRALARLFMGLMPKQAQKDMNAFKARIEADYAARPPAEAAEPAAGSAPG